MSRRTRDIALLTAAAALAAAAPFLTGRSEAGPEKVRFPDLDRLKLYATVDRYDIKQYRELYATPEAMEAAKAGRPLPHGTVLAMVQYKAQVDPAGNPVKDDKGRFVKGEVAGYAAMEKQAGWGAEYAEDVRNGEWEYAAFKADRTFNDKADHKACFACHKPHEKIDFVISYARIAGTGGQAAAPAPAGAHLAPGAPGHVSIAGFAFTPAKATAAVGQPITWTNSDDSPHQVFVKDANVRSEILPKGQSYSHAFDKPGSYEYACGLHPAMKATLEVK
jgi:plastocyanin